MDVHTTLKAIHPGPTSARCPAASPPAPLSLIHRFGPERREDMKHSGNFMVFGHGPHYCVGKEYATNHLVAFLAIAATSLDWSRVRSARSDHMKYLPTVYPYDSVLCLKVKAA